MRFVAPVLLALVAGCSPAAPQPTSTPPLSSAPASAAPSASAPPAAPRFDASRPDAAVLERLWALGDPGPLEGALNQASRTDLASVLRVLTAEEKADLSKLQADASIKALLVEATRPGDIPSLAALTQGNAWKALRIIRNRELPAEDLPSTARNLSHWAAHALAWRTARPGAPPLDGAAIDRLVRAAWILDNLPLLYELFKLDLALRPSGSRRLAVALQAARLLDLPEAKKQIDAVRGQVGVEVAPFQLKQAEETLAMAESLKKLGGAEATGEAAVQAALLASRLFRFEMVEPLLARSKVNPESDLRAAVASAVSGTRGSLCLGLETQNEPLSLCDGVLKASADYRERLATLKRAFDSGKGRDPWAIEAYLGYTQVMPLVFSMVGGKFSSADEMKKNVLELISSLDKGLNVEGVPAEIRDSFKLFDETLQRTTEILVQSHSLGEFDEATTRAMMASASALLDRHPGSLLAKEAALAVVMVLPRSTDLSPLLKRIPAEDKVQLTRLAIAASVGALQGQREAAEPAALALEKLPPWGGREAQLRGVSLAREAMAALDPSPQRLDALVAAMSALSPEMLSPLDHVQHAASRVGILVRQDRRAEAETLASEALQSIRPPEQPDSSFDDLLAALRIEAEALLSTNPDPVAQRRGIERLADGLQRAPQSTEPFALSYYRALTLKNLLAEGRSPCVSSQAGCRAATKKLRELTEQELKRLTARLAPSVRSLAERGLVSAGNKASFSMGFSTFNGMMINLEYQPRLLVLMPPTREKPRPARR